MWGGTGIGEPYTRAFQIGCHLDRGDVAAARRVADAALTGPALGEGGRLLQQALARLLVAEGRLEEALATLDAIPTPVRHPQPGLEPVADASRPVALRRARPHRRGGRAGARRRSTLLRRWGAPSYLGTALCLLGRAARAATASSDLREAVEVLTPTYAAVELARARCALGSRPQVPDDEAVAAAARGRGRRAPDRGALGDRAARPRRPPARAAARRRRRRDAPARCPTHRAADRSS